MKSFLLLFVLVFIQKTNCVFDGWWEKHSQREILISSNNSTNSSILFVTPQEAKCTKGENFTLVYSIEDGGVSNCTYLRMKSDPRNISYIPAPVKICFNNGTEGTSYNLTLESYHEGNVILSIEADDPTVIFTNQAFVRLGVALKSSINPISDVIGWVYTVAWDISFLPQIYHNYRRQSVIGLSFDFLTLNFIGFSCYGLFNIGLYWIPSIQDAYYVRNPTSVLHVRLNDVIFAIYAVICTAVQIIQCFFYERGNQRVSTTCRVISACFFAIAFIYVILVATIEHIWWIDFLYVLSYIKLAITCIKYFPQLYENYKRKSTEGWSIWNVILDFTGGSLSVLQMFLLAYNYDDFHSVLTDPSKLGLGLLSIFFNIFFFLQHYVIYRHNKIGDTSPNTKEITHISTVSSLYLEDKDDNCIDINMKL